MGFLEMIGFALYHAIKEEAEEERRRENLFEKLDKAESDFSSFCSICKGVYLCRGCKRSAA